MATITNVDTQTIWYILDDITRYLGDYRNILALIGTVYISKKAFMFMFNLLKAFQIYFVSRFFVGRNLQKICGGTWAVVTGATDGIGKAYANELAKYKYNIVLISRTQSKLEHTAQDLENKYGIQTKVICVDFSNDNIYKDIAFQLAELDIGILVNNVGLHYGLPEFFLNVPEKKLRDMITVNVTSMTMMTYLVLPGMVERKRGAIINLSSSAAKYPSPLVTVYAAAKAYVEFFSQGLSIEYAKDNIVFQCLKPYYVSTPMTLNVTPNIFVPTAENFARNALATLPYGRISYGYWAHGFQGWLFSFAPEWLWLRAAYYWHIILMKYFKKDHDE